MEQSIPQNVTDKLSAKTVARVVDLCCGMGGLSVAAREMGMQVVAGVDINPNAMRTFTKNFPETVGITGSVWSRTVLEQCRALLYRAGDVDGLTVLLSGPPCQGFSAAGSRDPMDKRNDILIAVAHAIAKIKPDCAVIENVSTVLAEKHSERLTTFKKILTRAGYYIEKKVLDSSEYGVPQKRIRAFFFITRSQLNPLLIDDLLARHKVPLITTREALDGLPTPNVRPDLYNDEAEIQGPTNHFAMRHSKRVIEKIAAIQPGTGPMSYRRLHPIRPANTLFSGHRAPPAHFDEPRSITVREAARLQGFLDTFRVYGPFGSQMEQVTNAVPPPLARAVLDVLLQLSTNGGSENGFGH